MVHVGHGTKIDLNLNLKAHYNTKQLQQLLHLLFVFSRRALKQSSTLAKNTQLPSQRLLYRTWTCTCARSSRSSLNNTPVFPASPWLPCRSAARRLGASDPTTWPTSAAPAAAITPAPPRMKMRRRSSSRGSLSKAEVEKRGRRKFPTTLGTTRTRTWQSAQVKPLAFGRTTFTVIDLLSCLFSAYPCI